MAGKALKTFWSFLLGLFKRKQTPDEIALERWLSKPYPTDQLCACRGKTNPEDPACACAMQWYEKVDGAWYRVYRDYTVKELTFRVQQVTGPL